MTKTTLLHFLLLNVKIYCFNLWASTDAKSLFFYRTKHLRILKSTISCTKFLKQVVPVLSILFDESSKLRPLPIQIDITYKILIIIETPVQFKFVESLN